MQQIILMHDHILKYRNSQNKLESIFSIILYAHQLTFPLVNLLELFTVKDVSSDTLSLTGTLSMTC